ncbi:MAG: hypothetical protein ACXABE_11865, partial [Candidatus Thorarchaeota archaeon]
ISFLESNYDFHLTETRKKGAMKNQTELSGWIGDEDNPNRVGLSISLRGKKEQKKFNIRIEIAAPTLERLQGVSENLVRELGFSKTQI